MSDQIAQALTDQLEILKDLTARVGALDLIVVAAIRELDVRSPGFRHECLESVSAKLAELSAAQGSAGLETRQAMMSIAEDMLQK